MPSRTSGVQLQVNSLICWDASLVSVYCVHYEAECSMWNSFVTTIAGYFHFLVGLYCKCIMGSWISNRYNVPSSKNLNEQELNISSRLYESFTCEKKVAELSWTLIASTLKDKKLYKTEWSRCGIRGFPLKQNTASRQQRRAIPNTELWYVYIFDGFSKNLGHDCVCPALAPQS